MIKEHNYTHQKYLLSLYPQSFQNVEIACGLCVHESTFDRYIAHSQGFLSLIKKDKDFDKKINTKIH